MKILKLYVGALFIALFAILTSCALTPMEEDRRRIEDLNQQLRQLNQKLEEYKGRIDELNAQLRMLNKLQGAK